jgi:hypothetical protein
MLWRDTLQFSQLLTLERLRLRPRLVGCRVADLPEQIMFIP